MGFANNILARRNSQRIAETKKAIITLEKNTNSIKDALVKVTGESEYAKGKLRGHREARGLPEEEEYTGI